MTGREIEDKVKRIVVDALCVEEDEVTLESRLTDDLGAESIDYLDVSFRLGKTFDIEMDHGVLAGMSNNDHFVVDDRITDAGMEELRKRFPYASLELLEETRDVRDFRRVFTVDTLVKIVTAKLACSKTAVE